MSSTKKELKRLLIQYGLEAIKEKNPILYDMVCWELGIPIKIEGIGAYLPAPMWRILNDGRS